MDELLGDFIAESREMLEALSGEMVAWEADPSDRARLDTIFRFFHTVKGNCGFFDFPRLEGLSHAAEDALSEVRNGHRHPDPAFVDAVLAVIDRIAQFVDAIEAGQDLGQGDDSALIAALAGGHANGAEQAAEAALGGEPGLAMRNAGSLRSVRLPISLLDRVMSGVSDMVLARNELARRISELDEGTGLDGPFTRLSTILNDVRDAITRTRMQRIETLFAGFPRLVRDLSAELGKQVMVEIQGGDVELDREVIEIIRDPLIHIIRNAIDHGIETPQVRRAAGKREIGLLRLSARQAGNQIQIAISDDGRGLDCDALVAKAKAEGVIDDSQAEALSDEQRRMLIFEPGFSTAKAVTAVSGRGVGLDVVRSNIERVGGTIVARSTPGQDCRFLIRLPLTLSIVPSITVATAGQRFAIPRSYVDEIFLLDAEEGSFIRAGGREFLQIRDRKIACASLAEVLGLERQSAVKARWVVLLQLMIGDPFAFIVDQVLDHHDLVVKPVAPIVMRSGLFVGTTQLDDGSPILMLDVAAAGLAAGISQDGEHRSLRAQAEHAEEKPDNDLAALLFIGLDGRRRAIGMGAVTRYEEADVAAISEEGGKHRIVLGDDILPLAGINAELPREGTIEILRLGDGEQQMVYAVRNVIDTIGIDRNLASAEGLPGILGLALVNGEAVEVLDALGLFAGQAGAPAAEHPPVCRIPSNDPWMQDFLRPLVEQAGYTVVDESAAIAADVCLVMAEADAAPTLAAAQTIRLRKRPESGSGGEPSIYRYDREAVLSALADARRERAA